MQNKVHWAEDSERLYNNKGGKNNVFNRFNLQIFKGKRKNK